MDHDDALFQYIRSDRPPHRQWHVDVPSGLSVAQRKAKNSDTGEFDRESFENYAANRTKEIDAVCITSQPEISNPTKSELNHDKGRYLRGDPFSGERVIIVEAKTKSEMVYNGTMYKPIGQLKMYSTHFRKYWDAESVDELLVLLGYEPDEYIREVQEELSVRLVDVPDMSVL
jgi:hypothetical protein